MTENTTEPLGAEEALARFTTATEQATTSQDGATLASLRLIATAVLEAYTDATHVLIESSDQGGRYMCGPNQVERDGQVLADWENLEDLNEVYELDAAASWLTWGDRTWEDYADNDHPYTNHRGGYVALDLRRIREAMA